MLTHKRLTRYKLDLFPFDVFCEILMSCGRQEEVTLPKCEAVAHFLLRGLYHLLYETNLQTQRAILSCPIDIKTYRIIFLFHKPFILNGNCFWGSQLSAIFSWNPCSASMNQILEKVLFMMQTMHTCNKHFF